MRNFLTDLLLCLIFEMPYSACFFRKVLIVNKLGKVQKKTASGSEAVNRFFALQCFYTS
jgi:hypothetical protein